MSEFYAVSNGVTLCRSWVPRLCKWVGPPGWIAPQDNTSCLPACLAHGPACRGGGGGQHKRGNFHTTSTDTFCTQPSQSTFENTPDCGIGFEGVSRASLDIGGRLLSVSVCVCVFSVFPTMQDSPAALGSPPDPSTPPDPDRAHRVDPNGEEKGSAPLSTASGDADQDSPRAPQEEPQEQDVPPDVTEEGPVRAEASSGGACAQSAPDEPDAAGPSSARSESASPQGPSPTLTVPPPPPAFHELCRQIGVRLSSAQLAHQTQFLRLLLQVSFLLRNCFLGAWHTAVFTPSMYPPPPLCNPPWRGGGSLRQKSIGNTRH